MNIVIIFVVLGLAFILFATGKWRYDLVALMALLLVVVAGIVPADEAFLGFGHPAVVTVAAVLIASRGLTNSGIVDMIVREISRVGGYFTLQMSALTGLVAAASAFMNNVGALALMMPVAVKMARLKERSPSLLLMPLAFGSLLGGLVTLIGTPPNIIIATFRGEITGEPFRMFDFSPVGLGLALVGLLFISLIGWRLIPLRKGQASREDLFQIKDYITEVRVPEDSKLAGKFLQELGSVTEAEVLVVGVIRQTQKLQAPSSLEIVKPGDILVVKADADDLKALVDAAGLELVGSEELEEEEREINMAEAVVMADSTLVGRTARSLNLRWRFGINLLAVARQGARLQVRLGNIKLAAGDVLLVQGRADNLEEVLSSLGCVPLGEREVRIGQPRRAFLGVAIFGGAIISAAFNLLPVQIALTTAAVLMILLGLLTLREAYESINWPVIILLGAMIPVGQALEATGGAELIASLLLRVSGELSPALTLTVIIAGTMLLSDVVNNAAAAVLMAPIALNVAWGLGASTDSFLMAVAVGASCTFLTPIGHQSNTLVMGPGGYRFGDYWRMGLPLDIIILLVAVPLIMHFWPLGI